jgi:hypothetical protein
MILIKLRGGLLDGTTFYLFVTPPIIRIPIPEMFAHVDQLILAVGEVVQYRLARRFKNIAIYV